MAEDKGKAGKAPDVPPADDKGKAQDALPAEPINPFVKLFSSVVFQTTGSGKIFSNADGSSSRKVAGGLCILAGVGAGIPFNVYARKSGTGPKARVTADVSFVGQRAVQALMPLDEPTKAHLTAYKSQLSEEYRKWRKGQGSTMIAVRPTAVDLDDADGLFDE